MLLSNREQVCMPANSNIGLRAGFTSAKQNPILTTFLPVSKPRIPGLGLLHCPLFSLPFITQSIVAFLQDTSGWIFSWEVLDAYPFGLFPDLF